MVTSQTKSIAIFASGTGTNALALIKAAKKYKAPIKCLICDHPDAQITKENIDIPIYVIPFEKDKKNHEKKILEVLSQYQINWIFLAGYMRILSSEFINHFSKENTRRIINIHPSLLPKYKGLNAYERSFNNNDNFSGITIHFVDSGIDTGEIIYQGKFERKVGDNLDDFIKRGKELEHILYPQILERVTKLSY